VTPRSSRSSGSADSTAPTAQDAANPGEALRTSPRSTDLLQEGIQALRGHAQGSLPNEALDELYEAVRLARAGRPLPSFVDSVHTAAFRPLLDLLRRRILTAADAAGDQEAFAESHALLMALEQLHDHLCRDDLYRTVDQFGGTNALDLLVEVAHDMRSPLGSILFLVDRVRSGQSGPISEPQARQLGLAFSAAFGLSALASDIMELARGSGRLMGAEPVVFTLSEVFRKVEDMVRPVAEEKGLALHMMPPPRDTRLGHPAALSRVLLNLATNACKFTSQGNVTVEARALEGSRVEFRVRDTGRGVPRDVAARLYDAFRPRTGSGVLGGEQAFSSAGLGLAICRKLVAAMGGELRLDERVKSGSCFRFGLDLPFP
jgi:signal transduction histidine kinase